MSDLLQPKVGEERSVYIRRFMTDKGMAERFPGELERRQVLLSHLKQLDREAVPPIE